MKVYVENRVLWANIRPAKNFFRRLLGLIFSPELDPEQGLLIWPCRQVHGFFMKYALDVIFLNKNFCVVGVCTLHPGQVTPIYKKGHYALEVTAGQARLYGLKIGDRLTITELTAAQ